MRENKNHNPGQEVRRSEMSGFSLLELMAVIAIIIVIAAMVIPQWSVYFRTYKINNDARSLIGEITVARLRAAASGGRAEVICDTSTTGSTALTCGIAIRQLSDTAYHGYLRHRFKLTIRFWICPHKFTLQARIRSGFRLRPRVALG